MLFNSYVFLLVFLPIVLCLWWRPFPTNVRLTLLAASSYVFYAYWDWRFAFLMMGTTLVDYWAGKTIDAAQDPRTRRAWLVISLCFNLGMLGFFKYYDFFAGSLDGALGWLGIPAPLPILHVVLPIGISFYIFESLTYTIDIYRRIAKPANSFYHYMVFISIFPKLIAGPIIRYTDVEAQYRVLPSRIDWDQMQRGIWFLVFGLMKKLLIADRLARNIDPMFAHYDSLALFSGWAAILGYSFQIYFDFSAYSDMAVGLGHMLGFRFPQNFNRPYISLNVSDFWERWHITLSRWLRDYLFIPLGGSRGTMAATARNLFITMFLGGLWHGANWTFVAWGLFHGSMLAAYHTGRRTIWSRLEVPPAVCRVFVFLLVTLAWVFFRAPDIHSAFHHFGALAGLHGIGGGYRTVKPPMIWTLVGFCALWTATVPEIWDMHPTPTRRWAVALATVAIVCLGQLGAESPFLYFQF
jgi:alginate O-acetyltransferase complex protein AlgI